MDDRARWPSLTLRVGSGQVHQRTAYATLAWPERYSAARAAMNAKEIFGQG